MKRFRLFAVVAAVIGCCFSAPAVACPPVAVGGVVSAVPQAQFAYGMQTQFVQPQFAEAFDPGYGQMQFAQQPMFAQAPVYQQQVFAQQFAVAAPVVYQQPVFAQAAFSTFAVAQPVFASSNVFIQAHGRHARIASRRAIRRANRHGGGVVVAANGVVF